VIAGKVWGTTKLLLRTPFVEIHELVVLPGSRCSMHLHSHKWNAFYVLEGELHIEVEKKGYPLTDTTVLRAGDICTVPPGEYHRFVTTGQAGCKALELYYPEQLSEDITRRDHGART